MNLFKYDHKKEKIYTIDDYQKKKKKLYLDPASFTVYIFPPLISFIAIYLNRLRMYPHFLILNFL